MNENYQKQRKKENVGVFDSNCLITSLSKMLCQSIAHYTFVDKASTEIDSK